MHRRSLRDESGQTTAEYSLVLLVAGAVVGVFTVLSVANQCAPATLNYRDEDPELKLDVVHGQSRPMEIRYAMSDNIGLGGHNGAVIFKRYDGD